MSILRRSHFSPLQRWQPAIAALALFAVEATAPQTLRATSLVSVALNGAAAGGGGFNRNPGDTADVSPNGRYVLFTSTASNLVTGVTDTNNAADLFLRDLQAGTTAIVSVDATGHALGANALGGLVFSPDSQRLLFRTQATNIVAGLADTNNAPDWFVRDLSAGTTSCVTINAAGTSTGNSTSFTSEPPVFSPDGNLLAFISIAGDLVTGVTDLGGRDLFLRNFTTSTTSLVSVTLGGAASGLTVDDPPKFSPDGHMLAFLDMSPNLAAGVTDTNAFTDLFVRNLQTATTLLVTRSAANTAASLSSPYDWTADGSTVVFSSGGANFVAGVTDANNGVDVFAWTAQTQAIRILSVDPAGTTAGNKISHYLGVSPDSRFVAFGTTSTNLVPASADGDVKDDLYVRDLQLNTTAFVAHNESSSVLFGLARFSPDNLHLLFETNASDVVPGLADTNGYADLFLYNLLTEARTAVTVNAAGTATANSGGTNHNDTILSPDGRFVSFVSDATDLVPGFTTASTRDLYVRDLVLGVTSLVTVAPDGGGAGYDQGATRDAEFTPDGSFLIFTDNGYLATPVTTPFNFTGATNLFAFDLASHTQHLLSVNAAGTAPANGGVEPFSFVLDAAADAVVFVSTATDMVAGAIDTPFTADVFLAPLPPPGIPVTTTTTLAGGSTTTVPSGTTTTTTLACTDARCTLDQVRNGPVCAGQSLPAGLAKQLDRAADLVEQAAAGPAKRTRKLLKRAKATLKHAAAQAKRAGKGKHPKLTGACVQAITGAAQGVASGLGV